MDKDWINFRPLRPCRGHKTEQDADNTAIGSCGGADEEARLRDTGDYHKIVERTQRSKCSHRPTLNSS